MTDAKLLPTVWIMRTALGWYPIHPSDRCKPEDHGRRNPHVLKIEDAAGKVLWDRTSDFQKDPPGTVYPPRGVEDITAYDQQETTMGFLDQQPGDPVPGENSSPAYRWGARNRNRDRQKEDDGFDRLRHEYIAVCRRMH